MSSVSSDNGAPAARAPLRELAALGVAAIVTRGELALIELSEARERAARWLAFALLAAVLLLAALLVAALWVVSIYWDAHRSEAIAAVAVLYGVLGGTLATWLAARLRAAPPLLHATLAELKQDCEALRGAERSHP